jgi:hypothetical protein
MQSFQNSTGETLANPLNIITVRKIPSPLKLFSLFIRNKEEQLKHKE